MKHMYIIREVQDEDDEWTGRINATNNKIKKMKKECMKLLKDKQ